MALHLVGEHLLFSAGDRWKRDVARLGTRNALGGSHEHLRPHFHDLDRW